MTLMSKQPELQINDKVTVDLYGMRLGKVVSLHDPHDGYGLSVEVELDTLWRGGKRYWFEAKEVSKQPIMNTLQAEISSVHLRLMMWNEPCRGGGCLVQTPYRDEHNQPLCLGCARIQSAWDALQATSAYTERFAESRIV